MNVCAAAPFCGLRSPALDNAFSDLQEFFTHSNALSDGDGLPLSRDFLCKLVIREDRFVSALLCRHAEALTPWVRDVVRFFTSQITPSCVEVAEKADDEVQRVRGELGLSIHVPRRPLGGEGRELRIDALRIAEKVIGDICVIASILVDSIWAYALARISDADPAPPFERLTRAVLPQRFGHLTRCAFSCRTCSTSSSSTSSPPLPFRPVRRP
jgi:hypothetical protein